MHHRFASVVRLGARHLVGGALLVLVGCAVPLEDATDERVGSTAQAATTDGGTADLFCAACFEETAGGFGVSGSGGVGSGAGSPGTPGGAGGATSPGGGGAGSSGVDEVRVVGVKPRPLTPGPSHPPQPDRPGTRGERETPPTGPGGGSTGPTMAECWRRCQQGGQSMTNFCNGLGEPRMRALCHAANMAGVVACTGFCSNNL